MKVYKSLVLCIVIALLFAAQTVYSQCTCDANCESSISISAPFSTGGEGEFCWTTKDLGAYIQSWGCNVVEVNGVDYTNLYVVTSNLIRDTTGTFYVYYNAGVNGHFEATGTSGVTVCNARWCTCGQYDSWNDGSFTIFNNVWGATSGQCIEAQGYSSWVTHSDFPNTGGVKSYPNTSYEVNMSISAITSCVSSFEVAGPTDEASYEASYDIWVPSEVMIWMNKYGAVGPIAESWNDDGTPVVSAADVTVGGHTWDVYHGGANVVSFVRKTNTNSGTVDIKAILDWIKVQGWIGDGPVGKLQFGHEITSAAGGFDFYLNSYSLSINGTAIGGGTITPTSVPSTDAPTTPPVISDAPTSAPADTTAPTADPTAAPVDTIAPTTPPAETSAPTNTPAPTAVPTATPVGATAAPTDPPVVTDIPTTPPVVTDPPATGCTCANLCSSQTSITVPFTKDGAGEFCWVSASLGTYINSWNADSVNINGTSCTNTYTSSSSIAAISGLYYIYYKASYSWSHIEIK